MSTNGAGKWCLKGLFIAALGIGVLSNDGIVYCGREIVRLTMDGLEKDHIKANEAYQKMLENQHSIKNPTTYLSSLLEALAVSQLYQASGQSRLLGEAQQQELAQLLARARASVAGTNTLLESTEEGERRRLQQSLRKEILAGRSLLPPALIQEGQEALGDSNARMAQLVFRLQVNRQQAEAALSEQDRQRRQVEEMLHFVSTQLQVIGQMLQEMSNEQRAAFDERRKAIQVALAAIEPSRQDDLADMVEQAMRVHQSARVLVEAVSTDLLKAWATVNSQMNTQIGTLQQLRSMVNEVGRVNIANRGELNNLTERLAESHIQAQSLSQYPLREAQRHLSDLKEQVGMLKEEVFTVVEKFEQRAVAETIATTLTELDYRPMGTDARLIHENGDVTRVVATTGSRSAQELRDDRIVAFDISRNGAITYDFIGYMGDSCIAEAERILAALRERGLYILDTQTAERLQADVVKGKRVTPEMLDEPALQHHPVKNKMQAELAERIHAVLERMNYHTIVQQVVGGCIEMDAFNGPVGYRVVVTPEGSMQLFKDAEMHEVNVELDKDDPIAAETRQVREQQQYEGQQSAREKLKQQRQVHRQQQLLPE